MLKKFFDPLLDVRTGFWGLIMIDQPKIHPVCIGIASIAHKKYWTSVGLKTKNFKFFTFQKKNLKLKCVAIMKFYRLLNPQVISDIINTCTRSPALEKVEIYPSKYWKNHIFSKFFWNSTLCYGPNSIVFWILRPRRIKIVKISIL